MEHPGDVMVSAVLTQLFTDDPTNSYIESLYILKHADFHKDVNLLNYVLTIKTAPNLYSWCGKPER